MFICNIPGMAAVHVWFGLCIGYGQPVALGMAVYHILHIRWICVPVCWRAVERKLHRQNESYRSAMARGKLWIWNFHPASGV